MHYTNACRVIAYEPCNTLGPTLQTPYELPSLVSRTEPVPPPNLLQSGYRPRSCDFTAHLCTGIIHEDYKLFVNPLSKTNQFCTYL